MSLSSDDWTGALEQAPVGCLLPPEPIGLTITEWSYQKRVCVFQTWEKHEKNRWNPLSTFAIGNLKPWGYTYLVICALYRIIELNVVSLQSSGFILLLWGQEQEKKKKWRRQWRSLLLWKITSLFSYAMLIFCCLLAPLLLSHSVTILQQKCLSAAVLFVPTRTQLLGPPLWLARQGVLVLL